MAVFKCKMCGGILEIGEETVAVCQYCGTKQTLPRLDDDRKANLYDRANHFRRNNEFDKAMGIYEQILNDDTTDAESYWSLVLCRYGIEYVEDPTSHKRIPTVNRAQFTSIFDDEDYKSALQYADGYQKELYEQEAAVINDIQKGILTISSQEEPFDVFICYKESDRDGRRTPDSVLATELYHELTREGYKVFFSRITLEDKLGSAYEPYIFAALNSAKVMVVLGTKADYFNAVWVKNEWSRYLALIKNGARKMLIPAYKDMDPYDLPEEFSHLQAQDMSKLGFMQDLIRGIKKIVEANTATATVKETVITGETLSANVTALLKRGYMALEDGEWDKADDFFEQCLNQNAELAEAYLGKLMAQLRVKTKEGLRDCAEPFEHSGNYQKALRFSDHKGKTFLTDTVAFITERNRRTALEATYERAVAMMEQAPGQSFTGQESTYREAQALLESIAGYNDADALAAECDVLAESARKEDIYYKACDLIESTHTWAGKPTGIRAYERAGETFLSISGWKDADEKAQMCQEKIQELQIKEEQERIEREKRKEEALRKEEIHRQEAERRKKRNRKIGIILASVTCVFIAFIIVLNTVIIPNGKYNDAIALMEAGKLDEAYSAFIELGDYKDASDKLCDIQLVKTKERLKNVKVGSYITFGVYEQDDNISNGKEDVEWLILEIKDGKALVISKYALDCQQYNTSDTDVTWETCTLRKWLNNDFINEAFSAGQKAMIPTVTVSADKNVVYSTTPGKATQDRVFLLSVTEANVYFSSDSVRRCEPTDYAVANGVYVDRSSGNFCWWWLRSPGGIQNRATGVYSDGYASWTGECVHAADVAVRPAMWISISD